ncbi:MAG: hypothetical protein IH845_02040 [Nanoarchaeota archaeon]|nr:hypothetical protein [Nanoarchaeota archaeon]
MQNKPNHDPEYIRTYFGAVFPTKSGSKYRLDMGGKISGREGLNGCKVELIAGLEEIYFDKANSYITTQRLDKLEALIRESGRQVSMGLHLAAITRDEEGIKGGLITSVIEKSEP